MDVPVKIASELLNIFIFLLFCFELGLNDGKFSTGQNEGIK